MTLLGHAGLDQCYWQQLVILRATLLYTTNDPANEDPMTKEDDHGKRGIAFEDGAW